jgi:hypothetical protein
VPTIDYNAREVLLRFGVAGAEGAGKTQVIRHLHAGLPRDARTEIVTHTVGVNPITSFDFTPPDLVPLGDLRVRCTALTVSGSTPDSALLARVMSDLDGLFFVADSLRERMEANVAALRQIAAVPGLVEVPVVFLYNKRDLPGAVPLETLDASLNRSGAPRIATVATTGEGIAAALSELSRLVLR